MSFADQRAAFSVLRERNYMANQCLGLFPDEALADFDDYRRSLLLRKRAIYEWFGRMCEMNTLLEAVLSAPPGSVALHGSATTATASILASITPSGKRRRIVISSGDFHSMRYLWHGQGARGFEIVEVEANDASHAEASTFAGIIDETVAIVALSLVSPRTGALLDARALVERAHAAGALVVIDAYQAVGVVPIRVAELGADIVIGGTHKWLGGGGMGLAFTYVEPKKAESLAPVYPGWLGHKSIISFADTFDPADGGIKFQQGSPAMEPIYTARAGIRWVLDRGVDAIRARSLELTQRLTGRALERGLAVRTPLEADKRGGMVCLDIPNPDRIVQALEAKGIDIDARPRAGLRIGPHPCATEEECDRVIDAVADELR
jgi:kynureninase